MRLASILLILCLISFGVNAALIVQVKRHTNIKKTTRHEPPLPTQDTKTLPEDVLNLEQHFAGRSANELPWDRLTPLKIPKTAPPFPSEAPYTLTMIYSVMGCNTCLGEQLSYVRRLTEKEGFDISVQVIVLDGRRDDVLRFKRIHRIDTPFLIDSDQAMSQALGLNGRMLLLLTDNHTKHVLAAHVPDPSLLERSQAFGAYLLKLAGISVDAG